jgi:hypothetical protein
MVDLSFTNYLTRQELFEFWYETNDFRFDDHCLVPGFVHRDLWGLDLPVRRLAKNMWGAFRKDVSRDDWCRDVWYQALCRWVQSRYARIC